MEYYSIFKKGRSVQACLIHYALYGREVMHERQVWEE